MVNIPAAACLELRRCPTGEDVVASLGRAAERGTEADGDRVTHQWKGGLHMYVAAAASQPVQREEPAGQSVVHGLSRSGGSRYLRVRANHVPLSILSCCR